MMYGTRTICCGFLFFQIFTLPTYLFAVPQLSVPVDTYNFGKVHQGELVKKTFTLKNTGDELLEIRRVIPSCGCTVSEVEKNELQPGEETALEVSLDTRGFSGAKVKTVRVSTNDPKQITHLITLKGEIQPEILVTPQRVSFGEIVGAEDQSDDMSQWPTQEAVITVRPDSTASLGEIVTRSKWLDVEMIEESARKKKLQVRLNPEVKPGEFRDRIVVAIKGSKQKTVNLPIYASVRGTVQVKPSTLSFGIVKASEKKKKVVRILSRADEPLIFQSVSSDHPAVSAELLKSGTGSDKEDFALEVTLDPTEVKKDLKTVLRIDASKPGDDQERDQILVSVTAVLPPPFLEKMKR